MENYKALGMKYLKMNKKRTVLTILGTALTVFLLYLILNVGLSYLDKLKADILADGDYEMVFYTETIEEIEVITKDAKVKDAYVGGWYDAYEGVTYDQALYVKSTNPYSMKKTLEYLTDTYGVEGELNQYIAGFYGNDGVNTPYILLIYLLLVSYIFALFGVGVIRNSIQLSLFEQIKDYGNMRCIGASKSQLRAIIYSQGAVMEVAGIVIGVVIAQFLMSIVSVFIDFKMPVHLLAIVLILVAYLGDLYFAMEENCKLVTGMTPVSALKGEFRIRKEKLKSRKKSLWGKLFGIEGDYAYKSLLRNPGKFYKSVGAMFIGITAMVACFGSMKMLSKYFDEMDDLYGYYQHYYSSYMMIENGIEDSQKNLPAKEFLQGITEIDNVTSAKRIYQTEAVLVEDTAIYNRLSEDYQKTLEGEFKVSALNPERTEGDSAYYDWMRGKLPCYGYDEEDYARCEQYLIEGTLEVSDNGIVVINGAKMYCESEFDADTLYSVVYEDILFTDYKVGDTIDIVDTARLKEMVKAEQDKADDDETLSQMADRVRKYNEYKEQLIEQGYYKTYTVEGVLSRNPNAMVNEFSLVFPLERYYAFTGENENSVTGMAYHIDGKMSASETALTATYYEEEKTYEASAYLDSTMALSMFETCMKVFVGIALFIMIVSSVNIINTTASNLHLRRKEFAQLRVIGVSKDRLIRMVLLEGVISTIIANVLGIVIGNLFSYGFYYFMKMIWDVEYAIPFLGMFLGLVTSILVLCGSVYFPMKQMKLSMAEELAASGE